MLSATSYLSGQTGCTPRGFIKLNLVALAFTVGAILFVLVALGAIIVLPVVFSWMGAAGPMALITKILRGPILLAHHHARHCGHLPLWREPL